jgi:iron complex transport system ATP-binding protein
VTPVLATRKLAVGYRARVVLDDVTVEVGAGTLVAVLGRNGAGKSSLLRTIAGMQPAMSGFVELSGHRLDRLASTDRARRIAVVLTDRGAVPSLSVRRVVEWGRYPHVGWFGRLSPEDHGAVDRALSAAGATPLADRLCDTLSDGEFQRVHVARALAQEPDVLLLDEPTAFLDAPGRVALMSTLRQLAAEHRLTVIVATHELDAALRVADVVWLFGDDCRLTVGTPAAILAAGHLAHTFGDATMASLSLGADRSSGVQGGFHA